MRLLRPRVLVVVADESLFGLVRLYFSRESRYAFVFEREPLTAIELLRTECFDAVVTDEEMARVRGCELAREARLRHPDTRTILMTGAAPPADARSCINAWLLKPFYMPALIVLIDRLVQPSARVPAPVS